MATAITSRKRTRCDAVAATVDAPETAPSPALSQISVGSENDPQTLTTAHDDNESAVSERSGDSDDDAGSLVDFIVDDNGEEEEEEDFFGSADFEEAHDDATDDNEVAQLLSSLLPAEREAVVRLVTQPSAEASVRRSTRASRSPLRYVQEYADDVARVMLEDIPDDEIDAALGDDDDDEEEEEEEMHASDSDGDYTDSASEEDDDDGEDVEDSDDDNALSADEMSGCDDPADEEAEANSREEETRPASGTTEASDL